MTIKCVGIDKYSFVNIDWMCIPSTAATVVLNKYKHSNTIVVNSHGAPLIFQ